MGVGVGPVDEDLDAEGARQVDDLFDRHDLTGQVGDMGNLDDLGPRGDGRPELVDQILL